MVSQQFLLCNNSTAANYKNWAQAISDFIRSAGWTNSSDTGQLNGAGPGPGGWAGVSTVPGSGAFYYEIFQPGDGLQNFYLKMEYGNVTGSTTSPTLAISIGTSTDGAGTLTGYVTTRTLLSGTNYTSPSTTIQYECDLSGDSGRLSFLLWRNAPNNAPQVFAVQRSLNSSGSPTSTYVTQWTVGYNTSTVNNGGSQQSLYFGVGVAPLFPNAIQSGSIGWGWPILNHGTGSAGSFSFNGSIPCWFMQPMVGLWDYPCTAVGVCSYGDLTEGVPFTITNQYGQTKTYVPSRNGWLYRACNSQANPQSLQVTVLVEYD